MIIRSILKEAAELAKTNPSKAYDMVEKTASAFVPDEPMPEETIAKVIKAIEKGPAKLSFGPSLKELATILAQDADYPIQIAGPKGYANLSVYPLEYGKIGSYGFNPRPLNLKGITEAAEELEMCLETAKNIWQAAK